MATASEVLVHGLNGRYKILKVNDVIHAHITHARSCMDYVYYWVVGVMMIASAVGLGAGGTLSTNENIVLAIGGVLVICFGLYKFIGIIDICISSSTITYISTIFGVTLRSREYAVSSMGEWKITDVTRHDSDGDSTWIEKVWQFTYQGRGITIIPGWKLDDVSDFVKQFAPYLPESVQPKQLFTPSAAVVPQQ